MQQQCWTLISGTKRFSLVFGIFKKQSRNLNTGLVKAKTPDLKHESVDPVSDDNAQLNYHDQVPTEILFRLTSYCRVLYKRVKTN